MSEHEPECPQTDKYNCRDCCCDVIRDVRADELEEILDRQRAAMFDDFRTDTKGNLVLYWETAEAAARGRIPAMTDYTPTTEEVRDAYATHRFNAYGKYREVGYPEFDRWLAAHDAEVREQAAQRVAAYADAEGVGLKSWDAAIAAARGEGNTVNRNDSMQDIATDTNRKDRP